MPIVKVSPINKISVSINQGNRSVVSSTSTFVGAANIQQQVEEIYSAASQAANSAAIAINIAQNAYDNSNTKLNIVGGEITGNLIIDNNLTVSNNITASNETIDAGFF